jgi:5-methylcytosine-specific restriction endonuclease McrA
LARIRSVHPGLFTDEAFMTMGYVARLLFIGIWTECDDQGIFEWKPIRLKMRVFPADNAVVEPELQSLLDIGAITKFEIDGKTYGAVKNFCKWQRPKSPKLEHPMPSAIRSYVGYTPPQEEDEVRFNTLRKLVWDRAGGHCEYCEMEVTYYAKKANSLQIDHRKPVSRGGSDEMDNLACACRECNMLKSDMTESEFRAKFAPSDLMARKKSRPANGVSQEAKSSSQNTKFNSGEATSQMEDGGGRGEEESSYLSETPSENAPSGAVRDELQIALDSYNQIARRLGLSIAQVFNDGRRKKLKQRLRECGGLPGWETALDKLAASSFCRGITSRDGWKADFDFLLQQKSFTKLMEGSYDDRTPGTRSAGSSQSAHDGLAQGFFEAATEGCGGHPGGQRPDDVP